MRKREVQPLPEGFMDSFNKKIHKVEQRELSEKEQLQMEEADLVRKYNASGWNGSGNPRKIKEQILDVRKRLDELSKKTLGSYAKKASSDAYTSGVLSSAGYSSDNDKMGKKNEKKAKKRLAGVRKAIDKMSEESDLLEAKMSDEEVLKAAKSLASNGKDQKTKSFGQGLVDYHKKNGSFTPEQVSGLQNIMKNASFQMAKEETELNEAVSRDPRDYEFSYSDDSPDGYVRPHVINKETGKTAWLGSVGFKDPEDAKYAAEIRTKRYLKGFSSRAADAGDREVMNFAKRLAQKSPDKISASDRKRLKIREETELNEKAESEAQQKAAAIALAVKRGKMSKSKLQGASKEMYDMSEKDLEDFAKTSHKGIPEKVNEEKYAKSSSKKSDDGNGLDPVGKGDSDVDNDGDSDSSDRYLKTRRKAIAKAMKKESTDLDEAKT